MKRSKHEVLAQAQLDQAGLGGYEIEYKFSVDRGYRFDFAYVDARVAIEIDGGTWTGKGHAGGAGYMHDRQRDNYAQIMGWIVLRYTRKMLDENEMIAQVCEVLGARRAQIAYERDQVERLARYERLKAGVDAQCQANHLRN